MSWQEFITLNSEELIQLRCFTAFELEAKIATIISPREDFQTSLKSGAFIDCFFNIYLFSKKEDLTDEEMMYIIRLFGSLLENCEKGMPLDENLQHFRIVLNNVVTGDQSSTLPRSEKVKKIIDYTLTSFFQHYGLYTYIFTQEQDIKEISKEVYVDLLPTIQPFPAPLEESIDEESYEMYLKPPTEEIDEENEENSDEAKTEDNQMNEASDLYSESAAELVLSNVNKENVKSIIKEIANQRLATAKAELEAKIADKETLLLKSLNKLQIS